MPVCNFGYEGRDQDHIYWWAGWAQRAAVPDCGADCLLISLAIHDFFQPGFDMELPAACRCGDRDRPEQGEGDGAVINHARAIQLWLWHMTSGDCKGLFHSVRNPGENPNARFSWPKEIVKTARHLGWGGARVGFDWRRKSPLKVSFRALMTNSLYAYHLTARKRLGFGRFPTPDPDNHHMALVSKRFAGITDFGGILRGIRTFLSGAAAATSLIPIVSTVTTPIISAPDLNLHYVAWDPSHKVWRDPLTPSEPLDNLDNYVDTGLRVILLPGAAAEDDDDDD